MKKWLSVLAALGLAFTFARCDFGESEEDVIDVYVEDEYVEETAPQDEGGQEGVCTVGQDADYTHVRIEDDPNSESLNPCSTAGNPGADIDAVCLFAPDDTEKACAGTVDYDDTNSAGCQNDKADPEEVKGAPDGVAADGVFTGYFSLNGGAIVISFEGGEKILCGDIVHVVEMYNPAIPTSTIEDYKVSIGASADGPWAMESDWATGETDIEISWEW